ncbi:hypothetical protein W97_08455 [Coniosporium apollinis CBS 100218]|uniref:Mid2 domain-containing protein n=1 Tax=Coniosporium apollinis (strain CBS 100218) TaxID=1168221 RepID=R7Z523_CONA1|nr:uncharacterized protein W97_08455 [Coniosporium apollinis CBS 100218]EON69295.1 hypothetical protein W97_08455 [Coniosporium apollinis CBS 100218]
MKPNTLLLALSCLFPLLALADDATVLATTTVTVAAATTTAILQQQQAPAATTAAAATSAQPVPVDGHGTADETSGIEPGGLGSSSSNEAGAAGKDTGAFSISKGGIAAIIAVVVIVAVFGIASVVLFYLAKKRQWEVRKSISRFSRRLTGRTDAARANRQSRRTGVRMASPPGAARNHRERDLEKGKASVAVTDKGRVPHDKGKNVMSSFSIETPVVKSWKNKLFSSGK